MENSSSIQGRPSDPAWVHFKRVVSKMGNLESAICLYCDRRIRSASGITLFKAHLAGIRGCVRPCPNVPQDVKDQMVELIKAKNGSSSVRGKRSDPAWVHFKRVVNKTSKQDSAICLYCDKRMDGGSIFRYKHHLAGIRGHGTLCPSVPQHVKNEMIELLKAVIGKRAKNRGSCSKLNVGSEEVTKRNVKKRKYCGSSSESEGEFEEISKEDSEPGLEKEELSRTKRNEKKEIIYDLSSESEEMSEKNVEDLELETVREEKSLRDEKKKGKLRQDDLSGQSEEESEKIVGDLESEPVREKEPSRDEKKKGEKEKYSLCGENSKKLRINETSKEVTKKQQESERKKQKKVMTESEVRRSNSLVKPRPTHNRRLSRRRGKDDKEINTDLFEPFLEDLWSKIPEERSNYCMYFSSFLFSTYVLESKQQVFRWIKKLKQKVFAKKYTFVPIVCWSHWSLLVLCNFGTEEPCMILLDSLSKTGDPMRLEIDIRRFIVDIYKVEEREENEQFISEIPLLIPKVPQQTSNDDCGAYVLYYIYHFIQNAPITFTLDGYPYFLTKDWFTKEDIKTFQKEIDAFSIRKKNSEEELKETSTGEYQVYTNGDASIVEID